MSNIYFMVFMMVVSYFYMTFSQFIGYLSFFFLLLLLFYRGYIIVGRVKVFLKLKHDRNEAGGG